jgi:hypothetical protein
MNSINLQNIIEYIVPLSKNNNINGKKNKINIQKEIETLLTNQKKDDVIKYSYIDLYNIDIFSENHFNNFILLYPLNDSNEIDTFIHSFLLVTNDKYINLSYREQINTIQNYTSNFNYNTFNKYYNYILINDNKYIFKNHNSVKYLIFIIIDNKYYPIINYLQKFYLQDSEIIQYIFNTLSKDNDEISHNEYMELETNNENMLNITEIKDDIVIEKSSKKQNKNIFILPKNNEESCSEDDLSKLIKSVKITMKLEELQKIALKLKIPIVSGETKTGNPKNRKKEELFTDIKNIKL